MSKKKEYVVIFKLPIKFEDDHFIGTIVTGNDIVDAISNSHDWIGKFAFKKKHPIDGYEVVQAYESFEHTVNSVIHSGWKQFYFS